MKKRLLFIIDSLGIGGAEKVTLTLAKGFVDIGYHIDIISCNNIIKFEVPEGIHLHLLGFKKSFMDYTRYRIKLHTMINDLEKQQKCRYDCIIAVLQQAIRLIEGYKHPKIFCTVHSTLSQSAFKNRHGVRLYLKQKTLQRIYNNKNIITCSSGIKDDLLNIIGIKPKSIHAIFNPIDIDLINKLSNENPSIPTELFEYIVHVGRLSKVKRHDILIKAYKKSNIKMKLILVGDGEEKENIIKLIKELELEEMVILAGFQANPYPFIKNAKLFVLSSEYEGLPTVLMESLALNTPIISTNCKSGPSEIMTGTLANYLTPVNDVDTLAIKIKEITSSPYTIDTLFIQPFQLNVILKQYENMIYDEN